MSKQFEILKEVIIKRVQKTKDMDDLLKTLAMTGIIIANLMEDKEKSLDTEESDLERQADNAGLN